MWQASLPVMWKILLKLSTLSFGPIVIISVRYHTIASIQSWSPIATLNGHHFDLCPVRPKEGPVVKHFTLLEQSHAGRVVFQGHFHHPGILRHCIRTDKKQLQLDMSGELIASRLLVRGGLDTTGLLVGGGLVTTGLLVRGGLVTTGLLVRGGLVTTGLLVTSR